MTQAAPRFNRQPAHVLMLDLSQPFTHDMLANLYQGLTDFFSLVTHINGPCRVPLFGMTAVGQYPETIFPLQHIKGNFARFYSVLTEFKRSAMDTVMPTFEPDSFTQGLNDIISQYQRQHQTITQVTHSPCQLELSILSCQPARLLSELISRLAETIDLDILKKIQVLSVTVEKDHNMMSSESGSPADNDSNDSGGDLIGGMVDIIPLENDKLSFVNFFKTWLKDCGTDCESIHIILPTKLNNSDCMEADGNSLTNILKCDLHETFINPSNLLCSGYFNLTGEFSFSKPYTQINNKSINATHSANKVRKLKAFCLVKTQGVCESVVYGLPMFVRPTCCWKLDWEELESNQQNFNALCKILYEKDLSLVVKSDLEDNGVIVPHAFFLIMTNSKSTLLIKAIAVEELMLPSNFSSLTEKNSQESIEIMNESLDRLPLQDVYNPYLVNSDLFKFCISKSLKNNPGVKGSKRRFQAPQKAEEYDPSNRSSAARDHFSVRQSTKRTTSQSPKSSAALLKTGGRNTPKRGRTLPAVAVLQPNSKSL